MKKYNYYYDYAPEVYNYIMASKILRQSEKNILRDIVDGQHKKNKQIIRDKDIICPFYFDMI